MRFPIIIIIAVLRSVLFDAMAGVQISKLDPPFSINSFYQLEDPTVSDPLAIDFDRDGEVDLRLFYYFNGIGGFFNGPTRVVIQRHFYPWTTNVYGSLGALPLGTVIGSNLVTSVNTNVYIWHTGDTNRFDDETREYGDHKSIGVIVVDPQIIGQPLVVSGDLADKEGVIAMEFLIGTNKHYGYIHFDFRE